MLHEPNDWSDLLHTPFCFVQTHAIDKCWCNDKNEY